VSHLVRSGLLVVPLPPLEPGRTKRSVTWSMYELRDGTLTLSAAACSSHSFFSLGQGLDLIYIIRPSPCWRRPARRTPSSPWARA
jgi:hypothetical protein